MQMVDPDIRPRASSSHTRSPSVLRCLQWPEFVVLLAAWAGLAFWLTVIIHDALAPLFPIAAVAEPEVPRPPASSETTSLSSNPPSALAQENN